MTTNLLKVLEKSFSDKSYQDISQHLKLNFESTKNGIKAIIPAVLASILGNNTVSRSTQPTWWNALDEEYPPQDVDYVFTQLITNTTFLIKGREVLSGMFRSNHDELVGAVSSIAGIQKEKAAGLIEVSVPLMVGYLKSWMHKNNWQFDDLIKNLLENKNTITQALPAGLVPAHFGVGNLPKDNFSETVKTEIPEPKDDFSETEKIETPEPKDDFSETVKTETPETKDDFSETVKTEISDPQIDKAKQSIKKKNNGLVWFGGLLLVALIMLLFWYLMSDSGCARKPEMDRDGTLVPGVKDTITNIQHKHHVQDGTYYAYKEKPDLVIQ